MKRSLFLNLFISLSIGLITIGTTGAATLVPITACTGCHGTDPLTNQAPIEGAQRNVPARAIIGSHTTHKASTSLTCSGCHVMPAALSHMDMNINMSATITGGTYSKTETFPVSNTFTGGTCNSTQCHGQKSTVWAGSVSNTQCTKCHGQPNAAYLTNYTSAVIAPGTGTTGRDTGGNTAATAPRVGAHKAHMEGSVVTGGDISRTIRCRECHTPHATVADATHLNRSTATITFGSIAQSNGHTTASVTRTGGIITCNNTYCHTGKLNTGVAMTPTWNATNYLSASATITDCKQCHGMPPTPNAGAHSTVNDLTALPVGVGTCNCHGNLSPTGNTYATMFVNKAIHVDGTIDVSGGHAFPYPGATHMSATGATTPATTCNCHSLTAGPYPTTAGVAPACMGCHVVGILRTVSAVASCYDCHGPTATDGRPSGTTFPNIAGSHTGGHTNFVCAACHTGGGTGAASHGSQNRIAKVRADVTVAFAAPNTTATWSSAALTCSALYCHSRIQNATGTAAGVSDPAVTWGAAALTCATNCHGNTVTRLTTGSHSKHIDANHATFTCDTCHTGSGQSTPAQHGNNQINVSMGSATYPGTYANPAGTAGNGFAACTATYCHSSVQSANGAAAGTSLTVTWGGAALGCAGCHGDAVGNLLTGSHTKHLNTTSHATITCASCHSGFEGGNTASHVNKVVNVQQTAILGSTGTYTDLAAGAPAGGYGNCNSTYCHSSVQSATGGAPPTYKAVTWGLTLACNTCHGYTTADLLTGSHSKHLNGYGFTCTDCHGTAGGAGNTTVHANQAINIDLTNKGGATAAYSGDSTPQNSNFGSCTTTVCHGINSVAWGVSASTTLCTECHGQVNFAYTSISASQIAPGGTGLGTSGLTTGTRVGTHQAHVTASKGMSRRVHCSDCHVLVTNTPAAIATHLNMTTATITFSSIANGSKASTPRTATKVRTAGAIVCNNTYCHAGYTAIGGTTTAPSFNTTFLNATMVVADCTRCHGMPPLTSGSHGGLTAITAFTSSQLSACNGCHSNINVNGTLYSNIFVDRLIHIDGKLDGGGSCISCHNTAKGTRSAITTEFGLAWGHKKSGRGAVTDSDCIVCHLEGDFTTQKIASAYHLSLPNGNIDLRDPDGAGETAITNNSGAAFTFTKYAISYAAASRTTTLGNTVPEVITVKFCMKCHDSNGATNPTARTRNATNTATTGTATMPFGGINLGTNYTTVNGSAVAGGLVNVASQFAAANSSRHPVGAASSRAYPYSTKLAAPYNNIGTTRDANTLAGNTASPRVKANSVILVCDDCHTTGTALTTRTITAHGAATSLRGTYYVTGPTLCTACHTGTYNDTANGRHNTGSAFSVGTTRAASAMNNCEACHFSKISAATAIRPIKASDIHGFNNILGGAAWTYGSANGMRPIAFLRNTVSFPATSPRPYTATVAGPGQFNLAAGQSTCGGSGNIVFCNGNDNHTNYSPGGSY